MLNSLHVQQVQEHREGEKEANTLTYRCLCGHYKDTSFCNFWTVGHEDEEQTMTEAFPLGIM